MKTYFQELEYQLENYLDDELEYLKHNSDFAEYIVYSDGYGDEDGFINNLETSLEDSLLNFNSMIITSLDINIDNVIGNFLDVGALITGRTLSLWGMKSMDTIERI